MKKGDVTFIELNETDRYPFQEDIVISRKQVHILQKLPGFIAVKTRADNEAEVLGFIVYTIVHDECEVVSLKSTKEGVGIGTRLLELVRLKADERKCARVWLITTNENWKAIRFYQKRGFNMRGFYADAVQEARKHKPSIPLYSDEGIPIRHEIEFELLLANGEQEGYSYSE
ncbi:Acetyltransferase (GNAT) family protein [Paenibacillus konkukensis]|uniref:Acetyltransferase (GNAT) family protein n=1 Tax=Paenibacillus konkukensis TaxID=2020716 RepID=A0ABY4RJP5_9BACL|nr:GNAT family N-acetyltransferase [Paenibacillus konkukensis]UQZ81844.1 Acetyltransferase (GNAT) family protein [Paenibacillus konkukensis]